jgi:hypothetical protein
MQENGTLVYVSQLPDCDFCKESGEKVSAQFDGKTVFGPWANMCDIHFGQFAIGLGIGRGQKLEVKKDD